jgi:hypothetical protein
MLRETLIRELLELIDIHFPVIHILYLGYAVCEFTLMKPLSWPPGHSWVTSGESEKANCPECKKRFENGPPTRRSGRVVS